MRSGTTVSMPAQRTKQSIIDSHVHLWPASMSNEAGHRWMKPGETLSRPHLITDYHNAVSMSKLDVSLKNFVFIETDARHEAPTSDISTWAKGPIDEIRFLRELTDSGDGNSMAGVVLWAPMLQPTSTLNSWLLLAEREAGTELWRRVKGFRYLVQGLTDQDQFEEVVRNATFVQNLQLLGRRGFVFDIGVDQHRGGSWQIDLMCEAIERAHDGVPMRDRTGFVFNHLCKPDLQIGTAFKQWCDSVERLSKCSKVYMKLSGIFSELSSANSCEEVIDIIQPWFQHIMRCFGPGRVMFGSDWPVCNANELRIDNHWASWVDIVARLMRQEDLLDHDRDRIWQGTAREAYNLSLDHKRG